MCFVTVMENWLTHLCSPFLFNQCKRSPYILYQTASPWQADMITMDPCHRTLAMQISLIWEQEPEPGPGKSEHSRNSNVLRTMLKKILVIWPCLAHIFCIYNEVPSYLLKISLVLELRLSLPWEWILALPLAGVCFYLKLHFLLSKTGIVMPPSSDHL